MILWRVTRLSPKPGERKTNWFQDYHAAKKFCDSITANVYAPGFVCEDFEVSGAMLTDLVAKARAYQQRKVVPCVHNQEPQILPHPMLQAAS